MSHEKSIRQRARELLPPIQKLLVGYSEIAKGNPQPAAQFLDADLTKAIGDLLATIAISTRETLYGPRLKLMKPPDGSSFTLLLDEFDALAEESKIVIIEVPRGQLQEWVAAFTAALYGDVQ